MKYTYTNLFRYLKVFIRPYWFKFTLGTCAGVVASVVGLYPAFAFAQIVTFVTEYHRGDSLNALFVTFALWFVSLFARNTLDYYCKMLCISAGQRASLDIEREALSHLSHLDIGWHHKENAGNRVKRIDKGSTGIITLYRIWAVNIISIIVNFVGAFVIIFHFDLRLALLMVGYQLVYYLVASSFRRKTAQAARVKNIKDEEYSGLMFEIINNIRSVKVLGMSVPLLHHIGKMGDELVVLLRKNIFWFHFGTYARATWQSIARILLILFVVYEITQGKYEVGFLILFYGYFNTLTVSVDNLSSAAQDIVLAKSDVGRLGEFFDEKINIDDETGKVNFPAEWEGIHIKNLSFGYGGANVLSDISFDIKKGEKIGIVGLSGAGKSTLFKLLLKEHEGTDSSILIGDVPLKNIKKSDYVKHVAVVLQDTEVFNMSLRQNVLITNTDAENDTEAFKRATHISHVDDFVNKLPQGVETLIGEKGVKLSGGEKQRLGIARAVFKNPEILFLDEATSHLDVESEQKIQDSLAHFFKNVTAVVIAHRLSTIREMDRIIVIQDGKIIETGSFDELYKQNGRLKEFWDKQRA